MTYDETVKWYHSFEKFGVVPGLERVKALCSALGDPQKKFRCVHVTGTNGKGSVCTETACVLKSAGYKTALYTSPEVIDFRERMQINGEMITEAELCNVTETVKRAVELLNDGGIFPTQFEVVTAAAFEWFAESGCDIAVLETGLGGRYDATNIIEAPLACAVVSVSFDHMSVLGDTLEKIAHEKSGIFKNGSAVVAAASVPDGAKKVIEKTAADNNCTLFFADEKEIFDLSRLNSEHSVFYDGEELHIPFFGYHQIQNAAVTVMLCRLISAAGFPVSSYDIKKGISCARIPARTEIISRAPFVMLDGCHNDASTAGLSDVLNGLLPGKRILAVMGMMADKDCRKSVENLISHFSCVICVKPSNPRSMPAEDFAEIIKECGVPAVPAASPQSGIDAAIKMLNGYDALIVCGSLYLAADIRDYLIKKFKQ